MPAYNEEAAIEKTVLDCREKILNRFSQGEIIVVEDCSTDATRNILKKLSGSVPGLVLLLNDRNMGHGPSMIRGLNASKHEYIFCTDSDGQQDPAEFWRLFPLIQEAHVVTGIREEREDPEYRKILSWFTNSLARWIFNCPYRDLNIPFKLFTRPGLEAILPHVPSDSMIPSILIMLTAHKLGLNLKQVEVTHFARTTGKCSLPGPKLAIFCIKALTELLKFRFETWHTLKGQGLSRNSNG